jgi:hypothetical protein
VGAELEKGLGCSRIDSLHQRNLRAALLEICLIDTDLIDPEAQSRQFSESSKRVEEARGDTDDGAITVNGLIGWTNSPTVGQRRVLGE